MSAPSRYGTITNGPQGYTVRIERRLAHSIERVWQAITDPDRISLWLAEVRMELKPGGNVQVQFTNTNSYSEGTVTRIEPPNLLEYTWQWTGEPLTLVRWELQAEGPEACRLVFTHEQLEGDIASFAAGWHVHLDILEEVLDQKVDHFFWTWQMWKPRYEEYKQVSSDESGGKI